MSEENTPLGDSPEEVDETTESATVEEPTDETQESDEEETEEESGDEAAEEPKKSKGIQKRFSDLTARAKAAELLAQRLEDQNRMLFEQAQRLHNQPKPEVERPPAPTTLPDRYDFENDQQYQAAVDSYMDSQFQRRIAGLQDQARQRKQQEEDDKHAQTTQEKLQTISKTGQGKYEDFAEVAYLPQALVDIVAVTENPDEIAYRWGKNPAEWKALIQEAQTNPYAVAAKIGRIDAEISAKEKKVTNAPPPVKPLGGRAEVSGDPDKMSTADWMKWREAQLKKQKT